MSVVVDEATEYRADTWDESASESHLRGKGMRHTRPEEHGR
jgi:hypothetical protein